MRSRLLTGGSILLAALFVISAATPAHAEPAETWTTVEHNVTLDPIFFPDDICGARAVTETFTYITAMNHLTRRSDGSFHFLDFETGYVTGDYVDPAIPDTRWKLSNAFSVNLTPGGTYTQTETLRQFDASIKINYRYHLTVVDGDPKVEREVTMVRGCP